MDIKEHFDCQQNQTYGMYGFSTLTKGISRPIYSFLPGVAELKLDVIDPIIL